MPLKHQITMCKRRISAHILSIERGRYDNVPLNERLCKIGNSGDVEDEYHYVVKCTVYHEIRKELIKPYDYTHNSQQPKNCDGTDPVTLFKGPVCPDFTHKKQMEFIESWKSYGLTFLFKCVLVLKVRTVTTKSNSHLQTKGCQYPIRMGDTQDTIWPQELERIFGFPVHYTDVGHISKSKRLELLGKAWSVPVVEHLLSPLRNFFLYAAPQELSKK